MVARKKRRVLRICMESPCDSETRYIALRGDESEEEISELANGIFLDWANYGHSVIDESEVPRGEEIEG